MRTFTTMKASSLLNLLRVVAIAEGISYLLFAITMPLKYVYQIPEPNFYVGMVHGVLFMAYIFLCIFCIFRYKLKSTTAFLVLVASLIPFGTFVADAKVFKPLGLKY